MSNSFRISSTILGRPTTLSKASNGNRATARPPGLPTVVGNLIFAESVADANFASRGWYDNTSQVRTTTNPPAGFSGSIEWAWTSGQQIPTNGGAMRKQFTPTETMFVRYRVRRSANWVGSGQLYHPHMILIASSDDDQFTALARAQFMFYIEDIYTAGVGSRGRIAVQDNIRIRTDSLGSIPATNPETRSIGGYNGQQGAADAYDTYVVNAGSGLYYNARQFNATAGVIAPGDTNWHTVEVYAKMNTITNGVANIDGILRVWIDDQLVREATNVLYRAGAYPNTRFGQFVLAPYIGDNSPATQTMWIGGIEVYDEVPADAPASPPTGSSPAFGNAPAGWTTISEVGWESASLGTFSSGVREGYSIKFVDATRTTAIETISDSIVTESRALTHIYPANHTGGGGGEPYIDIGGSYRSLYLGMYVKLSSNWYGHGPSGINKLAYIRTDDGGFSAMWVEYRAAGSTEPLEPFMVNQLIGGSGVGIETALSSGYPQRGDWHLIEVILELDTPRVRYWVDNVLWIDQSFTATTPNRIAEVTLSGIMGGIGASGNPEEQRIQYDRVLIKGA